MKAAHKKIIELIPQIYALVSNAINLLNKDLEIKKRGGGYLLIMDSHSSEVIAVIAIGNFSSEKTDKYLAFAFGQAKQLFLNQDKHLTSCQQNGEYPQGAVLSGEYIFSFDGQLPETNEAISALVASWSKLRINPGVVTFQQINLIDTLRNVNKNMIYFILREKLLKA